MENFDADIPNPAPLVHYRSVKHIYVYIHVCVQIHTYISYMENFDADIPYTISFVNYSIDIYIHIYIYIYVYIWYIST